MAMRMSRVPVVIVLLTVVAGCSWLRSQKECQGPGCEPGDLLDKEPVNTTWYCYGLPDGEGWDCRAGGQGDNVVSSTPDQD